MFSATSWFAGQVATLVVLDIIYPAVRQAVGLHCFKTKTVLKYTDVKFGQRSSTHHVWLRGSHVSFPTFSMQNFCGPLLPAMQRKNWLKKKNKSIKEI